LEDKNRNMAIYTSERSEEVSGGIPIGGILLWVEIIIDRAFGR